MGTLTGGEQIAKNVTDIGVPCAVYCIKRSCDFAYNKLKRCTGCRFHCTGTKPCHKQYNEDDLSAQCTHCFTQCSICGRIATKASLEDHICRGRNETNYGS